MRRRNFLRPDEFPYTTVMRTVYDSGDYDRALTEALRVAGYDELRREQAERRARGDRRAARDRRQRVRRGHRGRRRRRVRRA